MSLYRCPHCCVVYALDGGVRDPKKCPHCASWELLVPLAPAVEIPIAELENDRATLMAAADLVETFSGCSKANEVRAIIDRLTAPAAGTPHRHECITPGDRCGRIGHCICQCGATRQHSGTVWVEKSQPPSDAVRLNKQQVLTWLGFWRDKLPPEAVESLQDICEVPR